MRAVTDQYVDAALGDDGATFYALLTPDYVGITARGKHYSAGKVYGAVQMLRRSVSGIIKNVRVLDAHKGPLGYDQVAIVSGTADIIDSAAAHASSATWVHKIVSVRDDGGKLLIASDTVMQTHPSAIAEGELLVVCDLAQVVSKPVFDVSRLMEAQRHQRFDTILGGRASERRNTRIPTRTELDVGR